MPISALKVLELNEFLKSQGKPPLVEGLCERELNNPEGCGLDLRVGEVYKLKGNGFLGVEDRKTPEVEKIDCVNNKIVMFPNEYFLVKTMETIHSPAEKIRLYPWWKFWESKKYLMPVIYPRSTLQNCGIELIATKTDPGYIGQLRFGLKNIGLAKFDFEPGARMFNIVFEPVIGEIKRAYEGQWQGGKRASTKGFEKQN